MPVNVDTVYQTVQALANKEQRGYITPQEFNLFANQAQMDIFEQYFYDLNAMRERKPEEHEVADMVSLIKEKIQNTGGVTYTNTASVGGGVSLPTGRTGKIFVTIGGLRKTLRLVSADQIQNIIGSRWHNAGLDEAVYFEDGFKRIQVWSSGAQVRTGVTCENVTGKPGLVYWNYIIVNEKTTYDATTSRNFDLPDEEQADLVIKILELAGISTEDESLYQAAGREESQNIQQENK